MDEIDFTMSVPDKTPSVGRTLSGTAPNFALWAVCVETALRSLALEWTISIGRPKPPKEQERLRKYNCWLARALNVIHGSIGEDQLSLIFDTIDPREAMDWLRQRYAPAGGSTIMLLNQTISGRKLVDGGKLAEYWQAKDNARRKLEQLGEGMSTTTFLVGVHQGLPESRESLASELLTIMARESTTAEQKLNEARARIEQEINIEEAREALEETLAPAAYLLESKQRRPPTRRAQPPRNQQQSLGPIG